MEADALALSTNISAISETAYSIHLDLSRIAHILTDGGQEVEIVSSHTLGVSNALDGLVEAIEKNPNISQRAYSLAKQLLSLSQIIIDQSKDISKHLSPLLNGEPLNHLKWTCIIKWLFYKSGYKFHGFYLMSFKEILSLLASILGIRAVTNNRRHSRSVSNVRETKIGVDRELLQLRNYLMNPATIEPLLQHYYLTATQQQRRLSQRVALQAGQNILDVAKNYFPAGVIPAQEKRELQNFQEEVEATSRNRGLDTSSSANRHANNFALLSALENVSTYAADAIEEDQRVGSPTTPHPDEPAPPYSEFDDGSSTYSGRDTSNQSFGQPSPSAAQSRPQSSFLHPEDNRVRETAPAELSSGDMPLREAVSYSTLNSTVGTASNRFASTDTLIPRDRPNAPVELPAEPRAPSELAADTVRRGSNEPGRPRASSEILPPGSAVRIIEPDSASENGGRNEQSQRIRTSESNDSTQPSMSELDWQRFIQKGISLGDEFPGDLLEFQDATGRVHALPFDRCRVSFNNLVVAIHSRFIGMLKNPESLEKIEKAFNAPHNDVFFYKADYRQLRGEPGREFDISPVRWPVEAKPNMRICIQFNSRRLDCQFGLQRWRDMYPDQVPKSGKSGKLTKLFSWN